MEKISSNGAKVNYGNNNTGSTASRGSKYNGSNIAYNGKQVVQNSHSPPSVRNKVALHKLNKNSNQKTRDAHNQFTMYQSNHLPVTSQQSRRKSQVSSKNKANQHLDPLSINYNGVNIGGMTFQGQTFIGGVADTGAAPDRSGGQAVVMFRGDPGSASSSMGQYQGQNQFSNQEFGSSEMQPGNRMNMGSNNTMSKRFNMQNQGHSFEEQLH
jgi:hypothetical protein